MATSTPGTSGRINLAASNRPRRPMHPARRRLILGVLLVMIGSFLPWLYVAGAPKSGALGPGLWTFYAGMLGLAGVLLPYRRIGGGHAAVMAAVCLVIPVWQIGRVLTTVGLGGWSPGPGIVMVVAGGVVAAGCALKLLREPDPT
jgi:hypothetical protein